MPRTDRALLAALLLTTPAALGDDVAWIDPAGGVWTDPFNWSPARVPTPTDRAVFGLAGTYTVAVPATPLKPITVGGIAVSAGGPTFNMNGGTLDVPGVVEFTHAGDDAPILTVTNGTFDPGFIAGDPDRRALVLVQGANLSIIDGYTVSGVDITLENGDSHGLLTAANSTITVTPGSSLSGHIFGGDQLNAGASLRVLGGSASFDSLSVRDGAALEVADNGHVNAGYTFNGGGGLLVRDGGVLRTETGGGLATTLVTGAGSRAENITEGQVEVAAGGEVYNDGGYMFNGDALVTGPGSRLSSFWIAGTAAITDGGELAATNSLDITGTVIADDSARVSGHVWLDGTLDIRAGAQGLTPIIHMFDEAVLTGDGLITGDIDQQGGVITPGPGMATLTIDGDLTQAAPAAAVEVQLGPDGASDLLAPINASLQGALAVSLAEGYTPRVGEVFPILAAGTLTGRFSPAAITWPNVPSTRSFELEYSAAGVSIRVTGCTADHNGDGVLNIADFSAFRQAYLAGSDAADANGDGDLTVADLTAFRESYLAGCP